MFASNSFLFACNSCCSSPRILTGAGQPARATTALVHRNLPLPSAAANKRRRHAEAIRTTARGAGFSVAINHRSAQSRRRMATPSTSHQLLGKHRPCQHAHRSAYQSIPHAGYRPIAADPTLGAVQPIAESVLMPQRPLRDASCSGSRVAF